MSKATIIISKNAPNQFRIGELDKEFSESKSNDKWPTHEFAKVLNKKETYEFTKSNWSKAHILFDKSEPNLHRSLSLEDALALIEAW